MRSSLVFLGLLLAAWASSQGGSGGGLGGAQGNQGGNMGDGRSSAERPENEPGDLWSTKTAILTPGDRVEYKFTAKKGEAIFAAVASEVFDPALSLEDAAGKELIKVDDREEGDQSPFLAFRFPADGTYSLKVLSYRSAAGGKFTLRTRTFAPLDAPLEKKVYEANPDTRGGMPRLMFRIAVKKDGIVDLKNPYPERGGAMGLLRIVGPTGVGRNDLERIPTGDGSVVFQAKMDGDFYAEYSAYGITRPTTDFRAVTLTTIKPSDQTSLEFASGEVKLVEFPVVPDGIVRTTLVGNRLNVLATPPPGNGAQVGEGDPAFGSDDRATLFLPNVISEQDAVRVFHGKGNVRFVIRSGDEKSQRVAIRNTESLPDWPEGQAIAGTLAIGESRLFLLKANRSELMRIAASAQAFQIRLDLFRLNGSTANTLLDRRSRSVAADLYFEEPETLIARLTCEGYGGSGAFTLRRDLAKATSYTVGVLGTVKIDAIDFDLQAVQLETGKAYRLTTEEGAPNLTILDDAGNALGVQDLTFGKVQSYFFVPERSGRYRLWWRGGKGSWRFRIVPYTPPEIDG